MDKGTTTSQAHHLKRHVPRLRTWMIVWYTIIVLPSTALGDQALDLFNEAHALIAKKDYEQAVQALHEAIDMYPRFAEAQHLLGLVYFTGLNEPDKAVSALKQAITNYPNFARAFLDLGTVLLHQAKTADAEAAYLKALEIYPEFFEARLALANLHDQTQRSQKAIRAYASALELRPQDPEIVYKLAFWHYKAGNREKALASLDRLHERDKSHLEGWLLRGEILEHNQQYGDAIHAYQQALGIRDDVADAHSALGFLFQKEGQSEKAATHLQKVIRLDPNNPEGHLNFGVVLASLKRLDEAEHEYQTALSLDPNLVDAYYNLGIFYEFHRKDTDKALRHYREYLKRGGTDERIVNLVKKVEK